MEKKEKNHPNNTMLWFEILHLLSSHPIDRIYHRQDTFTTEEEEAFTHPLFPEFRGGNHSRQKW